MQFFSNPRSIQASAPENVFLTLHMLRNRWFTNSFKTNKKTFAARRTDNKKLIYCYKMLAFSDGTSFKRSKKPSYWRAQGGVQVNDIAHYFGCSRQTIHDLMNRYNSTVSVRVSALTWSRTCDNVTSLSHYTLTHPRNRFNQQPKLLGLYGVHTQKIINLFIQNNAMIKITSTSFIDLLYPHS